MSSSTASGAGGRARRKRAEGAPLTVAEAADWLSIGVSTVYDLIKAGQLRARKVGVGRARYRIDPADLAAYWERAAAGPAAARGPARDHLS